MNLFDGLKYIKFYESEIDAIKQELKTLPTGYLVKRGSCYYEKTGAMQSGITKNPQKVKRLARKAFLLRKCRHLEWNYSLVKKLFQQYKTEDMMDVIHALQSQYQALPLEYFFHPSVQGQFKYDSGKSAGYPEGLIYLADSGIRVRSKSELIIANILDRNKIPYRYEAALILENVCRHPDFTITRPSDGKMLIWEHLGLMGNEEYRKKASDKIALYARNGFFPSDNLICTYEHDIQDPARINAIIELLLLR